MQITPYFLKPFYLSLLFLDLTSPHSLVYRSLLFGDDDDFKSWNLVGDYDITEGTELRGSEP